MFYYTVNKNITNIYDGQPLRIVGNVSVFTDEAKTQKLTDMPFSELNINLMFFDCPHSTTEEFNNYIEAYALTAISRTDIQDKLNQVKVAFDLGLL